MSLQAALKLSRNSTSEVNTSAVLSLTFSIISISIAYHSYYLYKELKQEQKLIWRHISTTCRITKEDIIKSLAQEPTEGPSSQKTHHLPYLHKPDRLLSQSGSNSTLLHS